MATIVKAARLILLAVFITEPAQANEKEHPLLDYVLTDERIAAAIEEGYKDVFDTMGLSLKDHSKWVKRVTWRAPTSGFSVEIFTPYTWVGQQARLAARRDKSFTTDDVTEDMVDHVLHVVAKPDLPPGHPQASREGTSGVDHVIIRSTAEEDFEVLQPIEIEEGASYSSTSSGAVRYAKKTAVFDLQAVAKVAKLDENGEFCVVVIGTEDNEEKTFWVKTKHFEKLR